MELNTHICTQQEEKGRVFTQMTLDDDYIVRDNKPDVIRVIYTKGEVRIEDVKSGNQVLWVTGKLIFSTLYQSDDENHRLESIIGEVPFQEKLVMDDIDETENVSFNVQIEDLSVSIINSRKLAIRALLNVEAKILEENAIEIACSVPDGCNYEQKTVEMPMLCLVDSRNDILQIQRELPLPNSRTNIGELIFYQADFRNEEIQLLEDRIQVQMDVQLWVLYRSENTGEYECYETVVPISGQIGSAQNVGDEIFWAKITPLQVEVEARTDYDGEARMMGMELAFSVDVQTYREEICQSLQDTYSLDSELVLQREQVPLYQLLMKNISKIRLMEQQQIDPRQERILQICGSSGTVTIDCIQKRENGVQVEGVLNVHILYATTEDAMPFSHTSGHIPFEQFIEIADFSEDATIWIDTKIEQLQVSLLDGTEYEIKAVLEVGILAMKKKYISNILSIEEQPMDVERWLHQPGIIGYVRKDGEDLWDVAKKYHATPEDILEMGDKVLVVKQIR